MYEGMVGTRGLIMWSKKDETRSVGPLQPLTIGLIPWGFLWIFSRKYVRCVLRAKESRLSKETNHHSTRDSQRKQTIIVVSVSGVFKVCANIVTLF